MARLSNTFTIVLADRMNKATAAKVARRLGRSADTRPHDCMVGYTAMKYMIALDVTGERAAKVRAIANGLGLRVVQITDAQMGVGMDHRWTASRAIYMGGGGGVKVTAKQWEESSRTITL